MRYLCFDIESCDGGKNGSLCSFGYCLADENFNIIKTEDILVNPKKAFNKRLFGSVLKLAYPEKEFRASPIFPKVYDRIKELFEGDVIVVGFSVINDVMYLNDSIKTYGLKPLSYKFYDVQLLVSLVKNESKVYSLKAAAEECGIEFTEHRSQDDALATLMVLKTIIERTGKSFEDLNESYEIVAGEVNGFEVHNCYTDEIYGEIDFDSEKIKKKLLKEFLIKMPASKVLNQPLSGKVFCFDENMELENVTLTRNLIEKIYELGGRYSPSVANVNTFVLRDKQSSRYHYAKMTQKGGKHIKFLSEEAFLKSVGEVKQNSYDDESELKEIKRRRREKNELEKSKKHGFKKSQAKKQEKNSG